jgi:DNA invertase Pin-like site-specific DNA recombinase
MQIGYARVSTDEQDLRLQIERLTAAGCPKIFQEKISGAHANRPELHRMLEHLRADDAVVVYRLDRLARSTRDLLDIAESLTKIGAGLKSLSEPWADTTSPAGRMVLTIFGGIAEFERSLIRERTSSGRVAALRRGVRFGRPSKRTNEKTDLAMRLLNEGNSVPQVAKTLGVHYATLYRWMEKSA